MTLCAYHESCNYEDQTNELVFTGKYFSSCSDLVMYGDATYYYLVTVSVIYLHFTVEVKLISLLPSFLSQT